MNHQLVEANLETGHVSTNTTTSAPEPGRQTGFFFSNNGPIRVHRREIDWVRSISTRRIVDGFF